MKNLSWKINTSNLNKFEEFKRLFAQHGYGLETTEIDLKEINADPLTVVTHKASQLAEEVIVDDTSLDIEDASVGIHVRWLLDHLSEYVGRKATWTVLLALHKDDEVKIYRGCVYGVIVAPKGSNAFGFDPVFLPDGASKTLAEAKPDQYNARAKAVDALIKGEVWMTRPLLKSWNGSWQNDLY